MALGVLDGGAMGVDQNKLVVGSGNWGGDTGRIEVYDLDRTTGELHLVQQLSAGGVAAYMVADARGENLYVADETRGFISSYGLDEKTRTLTLNNQVRTQGRPVYLAIDRSGRWLTTCFFEEARTEVFALLPSGAVGESVCCLETGTESHCTVFDPTSAYLFVPTRGANWLGQYRFDDRCGAVVPNEPAHVDEVAGAGPRHFVFHPSGDTAYLVNELNLTISTYRFNSARGTFRRIGQAVSSSPEGCHGGSAADIRVHPNGQFLYVSNRQGDDSSLGIFAIDQDTRQLTACGHESTRGRTPRNFSLSADGQCLVVGNRESANVSLFRVVDQGARLEYLASHPVAPGPFFVGLGL